MMIKQRHGVTLIEVMMAVAVGAILSLAVTRLFSSGIRISQKGSGHLTVLQSGAILMAQLEQDIARADAWNCPADLSLPDSEIALTIQTSEGKRSAKYSLLPDQSGVQRSEGPESATGGSPPDQTHVFCRGMNVDFTVKSHVVKHGLGFFIDLTVRTPQRKSEEANLRRFIFAPNLPENRRLANGNWLWQE